MEDALRRLSLTRETLESEVTTRLRRLSEHGEVFMEILPLLLRFLSFTPDPDHPTIGLPFIDWGGGLRRVRSRHMREEQARLSRVSWYVVPPREIEDARVLMKMCAGSYGYALCALMGIVPRGGSRASLYPVNARMVHEKTTGELFLPGYQIVEDFLNRRVVLVVRGTSRWQDAGTDLLCRPSVLGTGLPYVGGEAEDCFAHEGMWRAAQRLSRVSKPLLLSCIGENNGIDGIQLTGHSLGAGVATLLHLLWSSDPDMAPLLTSKTIVFGAPSVVSPKLAQALYPLVTSVVCGSDVIARLGVPALFRLKREMLSGEASAVADVPGHPRMCVAGKILLLDPVVREVEDREILQRILVVDGMFADHMPPAYLKALEDCVCVV